MERSGYRLIQRDSGSVMVASNSSFARVPVTVAGDVGSVVETTNVLPKSSPISEATSKRLIRVQLFGEVGDEDVLHTRDLLMFLLLFGLALVFFAVL